MKINFKFPTKKKEYVKENIYPNPDVSWNLLLLVFGVLFLAALIFGALTYLNINKDSFFEEAPDVSPGKALSNKLNQTLDYFVNRDKASEEIIVNPIPFSDPSR